MRPILTTLLTVAVLVPGLFPTTAAPLLRFHFAGTKTLIAREDAKTFKEVMGLPETKAFRKEALDKLARVIAKQDVTDAKWVRPLLEDILSAETLLHMEQNEDGTVVAVLALRTGKNKGGLWVKNLKTFVSGSGASEPTRHEVADYTGWRVVTQNGRNVVFGNADEWVLLGVSRGRLAPLSRMVQSIRETGRPFEAAKDHDLLVEADLLRIKAASEWDLFGIESRIRLTSQLRKENFHTKVKLQNEESLSGELPEWEIPVNTITMPLDGFTAVRGPFTKLTTKALVDGLGLVPVNGQAFFWAQSNTPLQNFFALKVNEPGRAIETTAERLAKFRKPGNAGEKWIGKLVHDPQNSRLGWIDLPILSPFLEKAHPNDKGYIRGGVFPPDRIKDRVPDELLSQVRGRENLAYYSWELTGPRLNKWNHLAQFLPLISRRHGQLVNQTTGQKWLKAIMGRLGNTVTEIEIEGNQVHFTRKAPLGLSALELFLMNRWMDNPLFPRLTLTWPEQPQVRSPKVSKKPAIPKPSGRIPSIQKPSRKPIQKTPIKKTP